MTDPVRPVAPRMVSRQWSGLRVLMAATRDGKRAAQYQNLCAAQERALAFGEGFEARVLKRGRSFLVAVEVLRCVECGYPTAMRGLCGECACEDDSNIW